MNLLRHAAIATTLVLALGIPTFSVAAAPQGEIEDLKETLRRTGVFFRADAPYVLRNAEDPSIPIYIQIINGVEKTGKSSITQIAPYVDREPLQLEGVNVFAKPPGTRRQFPSEPILLPGGGELTIDARDGADALEIPFRWSETLELPREAVEKYLKKNFLGSLPNVIDLMVAIRVAGWPSQNTYLRVHWKADPLPRIPGWYRGDTHYHSSFTDNAAERGYPLGVTRQAALQTNLDWVVLADHSTDLNPEKYAQALEEVRKTRDERVMFIRGEEITTSSGKDVLLNSVHLLAFPSPDDPDKGFGSGGESVLMTGDGSPASSAMPLQDALKRISDAGGFAYAAHPFDPVSPVLRGGEWDLDKDVFAADGETLVPPLVGLEPWNRATTLLADDSRDPYCIRRGANSEFCFQAAGDAGQFVRLEKAIQRGWRPLLAKSLRRGGTSPAFKPFLAAGSDAHGDFNFVATMDSVDFLSRPSRALAGYAEDNAFGKLSTVVYCPQGMGPRGECVLRALRDGQSVLSNGPLLVVGIDMDGDGSFQGEKDVLPGGEAMIDKQHPPSVQIQWESSPEFGPVVSIRRIQGTLTGESAPDEIPIPAGKEISSGGAVAAQMPTDFGLEGQDWAYIRFELRTRGSGGEEFRCYTNPLWIRASSD